MNSGLFVAILCCSAAAFNLGPEKKCDMTAVPTGFFFGSSHVHMFVQLEVRSGDSLSLQVFSRGKFSSYPDLKYRLKNCQVYLYYSSASAAFSYDVYAKRLEKSPSPLGSIALKYSGGQWVYKPHKEGKVGLKLAKKPRRDWVSFMKNFGVKFNPLEEKEFVSLLEGPSCPVEGPRLGFYRGCDKKKGFCLQTEFRANSSLTLDFIVISSKSGIRFPKVAFTLNPSECGFRLSSLDGKSWAKRVTALLQPKQPIIREFLEKIRTEDSTGVYASGGRIKLIGTALKWTTSPLLFSKDA